MSFDSIDELETALGEQGYLPDRGLATALFLSLTLDKPLLLEGEAGVGKTEAAKALAAALGARLIRLQCYEGLDVAHAVYEWNYARQLLHIRAAQEGTVVEAELFGPEFLIRRPLLEAIECDEPVVLLIDEIDRADEEFEAFLLEVLSDFQITIPEIGTISRGAQAARDPHLEPHARAPRRARSAAASSTGSAIPRSSARSRSCSCACRASPSGSPPQAARVRARAARARPREAARRRRDDRLGAARSRRSAARSSTPRSSRQTLGSVLKYHEDVETVRDETLAGLRRGGPELPGVAPFVRQVVTFGRVLREAGLEVGPGRLADALTGLDAVELARRDDVYWTLRRRSSRAPRTSTRSTARSPRGSSRAPGRASEHAARPT